MINLPEIRLKRLIEKQFENVDKSEKREKRVADRKREVEERKVVVKSRKRK